MEEAEQRPRPLPVRAAAVPGSAVPAAGTGRGGRGWTDGTGRVGSERSGRGSASSGQRASARRRSARAHHDRVSPERGAPPRKPVPAAAGAGRTRPAATGAPTGPRARLCPGPARSTGPARSSAAAPPRAGPRSPPAAGARGRRRPAAGPGAGAGIGAAAPSPLCGMREAPCLHHCQSKLFFSLRLHCPRCAPGALPPPPLAQWGPGYRQPAPGTGIALEPETAGRGLREGRRHRRGRGEPGAASGRGRGEPPGGVLCTRSGGGGGSRPRRLPSRGSGWNRALGCPEGNWGGLGRARCGGTWV